MHPILRLYVVVALCGWAVRPILRRALGHLPDRGHAASRCFGLILSTWVAFVLVDLSRTPLSATAAAASIALLALIARLPRILNFLRAGVPAGPGGTARDAPRRGRLRWASPALAGEALFVSGILLFSWVQSHNPAVDPDSERFMDYAFLQAHLRSTGLPAPDPWFAGEPANYYGFGYATAGFLLRAAGLDPSEGFTAVVALVHALLWVTVFGIGLALTRRRSGGLVAALLVLGAGNFAWMLQAARGVGPGGFDWFGPARAIEGTITEFPWFSLLWGDLHPYVIGLPVFACALSFAVAEGLAPAGRPGCGGARAARAARGAGFAIAAGAALATHAWDLTVLVVAGTASVALARGARTALRAAAVPALALAGALPFLPFLAGFEQWGRRLAWVGERSDPLEWAAAFGPFILLLLLAAAVARRRRAEREEGAPVWTAEARVAAGLAGTALLAAAACEVVFVRDIFDSTPLFRMNTVFKIYRLSWLLLGAAAAPLAGAMLASARRRALAALLLVAALSGVYPVLGTRRWLAAREAAADLGDDAEAAALRPGAGAADLFRARSPGDAAVAAWLEGNAGPEDVLLEEVGEAYTWSSRISTFSGVPAVLGWANHEAGWRGDWGPVLARRAEVDAIYRDPGSERARSLLRRRRVSWVVVGEREKRRYGAEVTERFDAVGRRVLERGGTVLYRIVE
ncbi:MAG: DUF2298 domain-containing protein [Acidobacteriota bacterium]